MNSFSPTSINIASQPFRRERAQNAILVLVCTALVLSLLLQVTLILHARSQAADLRRGIDAETRELNRWRREAAQFSTVLRKPENADVFSTSVFLNELIARRAVSWTRVFNDLGAVLPNNMRLMGVRLPQVSAEGTNGVNRVQLDMVVGTDQPEAVIELLKRLRLSGLFGPAQVMMEQPPTQNDPFYKYRVTVAYAQKL